MISLILQFKRRPIAILCPFRSDLWLDEKDLRSRKEIFPLFFNLPFFVKLFLYFFSALGQTSGSHDKRCDKERSSKDFFSCGFSKKCGSFNVN